MSVSPKALTVSRLAVSSVEGDKFVIVSSTLLLSELPLGTVIVSVLVLVRLRFTIYLSISDKKSKLAEKSSMIIIIS